MLNRYTGCRKKDVQFKWTENEQKSMDTLKELLTTAPILAFADFNGPFILYTDASSHALGYNLTQHQDDKERAILYGGRNFTATEMNYSTTEREALAVVVAIEKCRPYLFGKHFTVVTDHQSLRWLLSIKDPTGRLARWSLKLQQYTFTIQYRPGKKHGNADSLSRRIYGTVSSITIPNKTIDDIKDAQRQDSALIDLIMYLDTQQLPQSTKASSHILKLEDHFNLNADGLLYHITTKGPAEKHQLVVPKPYRYELMQWCHDHPVSAHFGMTKTYERIRLKYYWSGMYRDVENWLKACLSCAQKKRPIHPFKSTIITDSGCRSLGHSSCRLFGTASIYAYW